MTLESLKDLYVEELRDIYDAEKQLTKALEEMEAAASNKTLSLGFREHLRVTEQQIQRLENIFDDLGIPAKGKTCKAMQGLVKEGKSMIKEDAEKDVKDAGLIAAAQRVEHYEISAYGTLAAYAEFLGRRNDAKLLQQTLREEKLTDQKLNEVAMNVVNPAALRGNGKSKDGDLQSLSRDDLYQRAQKMQITGRSKMSREQLMRAIMRLG